MLIGCYYRCPVVVEEGDKDYPRFFVLAQLVEYNEIADAIRVKMHDLLGSNDYYGDILRHDVFRAEDVTRCEAMPGGVAEGLWGRGTIVARTKEPFSDEEPYWYWVRLPNGKCIKVCETEMKIEYSQMNFSPEKQLSTYEFQHPTWFINRLKVSKNSHIVNNATYGFRILSGCRAYLMPHQVSTVARCFETMPVRYMLADEVGLGKTVEACSILSILASENDDLKTLAIIPGALLSQWKNELYYKYGIVAGSTPDAAVRLLPLEDISLHKELISRMWDLVIVDETHRLLGNDSWYQAVQEVSRKTQHILLLSATPIQDRNEEYRRLLALLSPDQYACMTSERFAWMVQKQKKIQNIVNQQLGRLDRYEEYADAIFEKLTGISETLGDSALSKLIKKIDLSSEDRGLENAKRALAYICENYRLERKVIRNRRALIGEKLAQRTLHELPYKPLSLNENYNEIDAIQSAIEYLSENGDNSSEYVTDIAIPLLSALFSSPWAYKKQLKKLGIDDNTLVSSASEWAKAAENERNNVMIALDEDPSQIKGRLLTALNYIDRETDLLFREDCKIVVFTAHNKTLNVFLEMFNERFESENITAVAFGSHMGRDELEDSVYSFQNDPNCRCIICDETGGEGRNFQNAEQVIHLDIPWNANALEQRIGRLDRLGRDAEKDVLSVVLYAEDTIEQQLFRIWKDGMRLFTQSLSGLEIITGELNSLIVEALSNDYNFGLINAFDDIVEQADEMRESVEDEQDFDLGATLYRPLSQGIDNVLQIYNNGDDNLFASAMLGWGGQAGLFAEPPTESGLIEFRESRFSVNAAKQSLFIAPDWSKYNNSEIMRREGKLLGSFDRKTAATREDILFYAPGDPVYDAIMSNAMGCSRGRCAAIGTRGTFDYDGIVYIFNIEPMLDELLENGIGFQTLSQYRMYLPLEQIIIQMPLTKTSQSISDKEVIQMLYGATWRTADHLGRRSANSHMNISPLERFILKSPPEQWEPLIEKASKIAFKKATTALKEAADLSFAKKEMNRVLNGYRAECLYFGKDDSGIDSKSKEFELTYRALASSKPVLDAVCFLRVRRNG